MNNKLRDPEEIMRKLIELRESDKNIRGTFITSIISVDVLITDILAKHFCSDENKQKELYPFFLRDVSLSQKTILLKKIINSFYQDYKQTFPNLSSDLKSIIDLRNELAHARLDTSNVESNILESIKIILYRKGKETIKIITKKFINDKLKTVDSVMAALFQLRLEIENRKIDHSNL